MNIPIKLNTFILLTLCVMCFWGSFALDIIVNPNAERYPLHRYIFLFSFALYLFNFKQISFLLSKNIAVVFLVFYTLITTLWVNNTSECLKYFVFLLFVLIIAALSAFSYAYKKNTFLRSLFFLYLILVGSSIYMGHNYPQIAIDTVNYGKVRWIGITSHPNALGAQGMLFILLSSNLFFISKSFIEKIAMIVSISLGYYVIIKADSMTSFAVSTLMLVFISYSYYLYRLSFPLKLILFFTAGLFFLIVISLYMSFDDIVDTIFKSAGRSSSFSGRTKLWDSAFSALNDSLFYFVFGYGFDHLLQLTRKFHLVMSHLHNGYIQVFVQGGLIAITSLLWIFIKTFKNILTIKKINNQDFTILASLFFAILIHNFTESSFLQGYSILNILLIFVIICSKLLVLNRPTTS